MKFRLVKLIPMWMMTGILPCALNATDFNYTYEGQTITYTILDETAKTVKTKDGSFYITGKVGNVVEGSLILPETVYYENEPYTLTTIGNDAFFGCSGLTDITMPNSVTTIGDTSFRDCTGLTSLTLPNSVTTIGINAFYGCSGLTQDIYNDKIFAYASRQPNRTSCAIPDGIEIIAGYAFFYFSDLTSVTLPNSLTTIEKNAFIGCSNLANITLPNSLTTIGKNVFGGCTGLTSLTLPNSVTAIGEAAFYNCSGLTSVTLPATLTSIGNSVFSGCTGLTSLTLPNSVTTIDGYAFYECSGLTSITLPNSLTEIKIYAFCGCSSLGSITLPNSLDTIDFGVFYGCSGLTSITLPNSLTTIGSYAFYGCNGLIKVYYGAEEPISGNENIFDNDTYAGTTLYVQESAIAKCREIDPWKNFQNIEAHDFSGIGEVEADTAAKATVAGYWNVQGVRADKPHRGLNLVRYSDGTVRKEVR